jgi:hypothetical protein
MDPRFFMAFPFHARQDALFGLAGQARIERFSSTRLWLAKPAQMLNNIAYFGRSFPTRGTLILGVRAR